MTEVTSVLLIVFCTVLIAAGMTLFVIRMSYHVIERTPDLGQNHKVLLEQIKRVQRQLAAVEPGSNAAKEFQRKLDRLDCIQTGMRAQYLGMTHGRIYKEYTV